MKINFVLLFVLLTSALMAQTITISPNHSPQDSYLTVGISGVDTDFQSGSTTCGSLESSDVVFKQGTTTFNPVYLDVASDTYFSALLDIPSFLPLGIYDIHIWEGGGSGCEVSCVGCFTVTEPASNLNIDPDTGGTGEELKVTISGENTVWTQGSSCLLEASNIIFSQGTSTIFTPDFIEIISDDTICAWITVPEDADLGFYNVAIDAFNPCGLDCSDCFEVYEGPEPGVISGGSSSAGGQTTLNLSMANGSYSVCDLTTENVFLFLNGEIIFPTSVMVENEELIVVFDIPADATVGFYDIVIGYDLEYECNVVCEACFEVSMESGYDEISGIDVNVYPNPFDNQFGLYSASVLEEVTIALYSMTGQLVYQEQLDRLNTKQIELAHLPKGVYCLKVTSKEGELSKRLIHQ